MCGILGMGFQLGHSMNDSEMVKKIWCNLLMESNARGGDATGSAFINLRNAMIIKHHIPARTFVHTNYYNEIVNRRIKMGNEQDEPIILIGHTRMKTKGTPMDMHNNHPILADSVVGVHNGHINNDDALFDLYEDKGVKRKARVDSEVIFRLVDYHMSNVKDMSYAIKNTSKVLMGAFACAAVHVETPWVLWLFRFGNPIVIYRYPKRGLVIFASEKRFIDKATEEFDLGSKAIVPIESEQGLAINMRQNRQTRFVLQRDTSKHHSQQSI